MFLMAVIRLDPQLLKILFLTGPIQVSSNFFVVAQFSFKIKKLY